MEKVTFDKENKHNYLREDIKPIMACFGKSCEQLGQSGEMDNIFKGTEYIENTVNIDYFYNKPSSNPNHYITSLINEKNKFSKEYRDCTGLFVVSEDSTTGKNISLLTHQSPYLFEKINPVAGELENRFIEDIKQKLDEIKKRSVEKTIDAVIVGGNYLNYRSSKDDYTESIKILEQLIFEKLGFYPTVIIGPKTIPGSDTVFCDNKNRRVYIGRDLAEEESFS